MAADLQQLLTTDVIDTNYLNKITCVKNALSTKHRLSFIELIENIRASIPGGLSDIEVLQCLRTLVDANEVSEELGACTREYYLQKQLSEYECTRQALISAYSTKPFSKASGAIEEIIHNEMRQLQKQEILIADQTELYSRRVPRFSQSINRENNRTKQNKKGK